MAKHNSVFWAVSLGHLITDMFNSMGPVLLVFLSAHVLSLTNTQIGIAVSANQLAGALSQPLFGWLGDRTGGRWLGAGGIVWSVFLLLLAMILAQATGQFVLMLVPYVLAALGSGAFHPVGAMHASESNRARATTNTSLFFFSGQIGLAIGPALVGFLLDRVATHNNLFTGALGPAYAGALIERGSVSPVLALSLIALPGIVWMAWILPNARAHTARRAASASAGTAVEPAVSLALPLKALLLLALVVALRSLINPGTVPFIPRMFQAKGWDAAAYGAITGFFWIGGGIAGVIMGSLADRYDSRYLVAVTLCLSAPALFLLPMLDGPAAFTMALLTGALSGGSHSLLVVQAQRLIPGRKGFASGAILGFMFATGALGSLIIGSLSDAFSLQTAFHVVAAVTVVAGVLGLALPPDKRDLPLPASPAPEPVASGAD